MTRPSIRLRRPRRLRAPRWAPEPPVELPPGRIVHVPGRGEFFVRDSGGEGPAVLLLHGWMFTADLNWYRAYGPLAEAGLRVIALDHRGHGRGLRTHARFTLADCAADAAAVLRTIGAAPAFVVGYSMGGPIASLLARDEPDVVRGVVLCATAGEWGGLRLRAFWRTMGAIRFTLGLAPLATWRRGLRAAGFPDSPTTTWLSAELTRGSARDLAEAGREMARYDASPWLGSLDRPAAVIVTRDDRAVPPGKQRALASALGATRFETRGDHGAVIERHREFNATLLQALAAIGAPLAAVAAAG